MTRPVRVWRQGDRERTAPGLAGLAEAASAQGRDSLSREIRDVDALLSVIRGRVQLNAETALFGASSSSGERVQASRSHIPREVAAALAVQFVHEELLRIVGGSWYGE